MNWRQTYRLFALYTGVGEIDLMDYVRFARETKAFPSARDLDHPTPEAVASLVIGVLGAESKRQAGPAIEKYGPLPAEGGRCGLTGATTLQESLTRALAKLDLANRIERVVVVRGKRLASIIYHQDGNTVEQLFQPLNNPPIDTLFAVEGRLRGVALIGMAEDLAVREAGEWTLRA